MANFSISFGLTMGAEGGYSNNPADNGGQTYAGVARNYWGSWGGWAIIDSIIQANPGASFGTLDAAFAANASLQQQVQAFYQANFWNVNSTGQINDQQIANQVFDSSVNCGTGTGARFLQNAAGVTADGIVGPQTLAAVNAANPETLYNQFLALRKAYYEQIIANNPSQAQFQNSWFSRLWPYVQS